MAQAISTLCARHFQGGRGLSVLRDAVRCDSLSEGGPWRGVLELLRAVEEPAATLGTYINSCKREEKLCIHRGQKPPESSTKSPACFSIRLFTIIKMVLVMFSGEPPTEGHLDFATDTYLKKLTLLTVHCRLSGNNLAMFTLQHVTVTHFLRMRSRTSLLISMTE